MWWVQFCRTKYGNRAHETVGISQHIPHTTDYSNEAGTVQEVKKAISIVQVALSGSSNADDLNELRKKVDLDPLDFESRLVISTILFQRSRIIH